MNGEPNLDPAIRHAIFLSIDFLWQSDDHSFLGRKRGVEIIAGPRHN